MATNIVTATLVVNFSSQTGSESQLIAEIDGYPSNEGGLNNGKTSFSGGDSPGYLVYYTSDVTILEHLTSLGFIQSLGTRLVNVSEFLEFPKTKEASLSKPAVSMPTITWYGNSLPGGVLGPLGTNVLFTSEGVAVCKAEYTSLAHQFRLTNIPATLNGDSEFEALIYIAGATI